MASRYIAGGPPKSIAHPIDALTLACSAGDLHPAQATGTALSVGAVNCTADESSGTCNYRLQWHPASVLNTIDRIQDENDGEQQWPQACTSGTNPAFTVMPNCTPTPCNNGDGMREQTAFWAVSSSRDSAATRVWSQVTTERDDWVHPVVDTTGNYCDQGPGNGSCFDPYFTHGIYVSTADGIHEDTWRHEYGHYVNWTYGSSYYTCVEQDDEGASIEETFADLFGELSALEDTFVSPNYGALFDFSKQAPAAFFGGIGGEPPVVWGGTDCSTGDTEHGSGIALEQAMWEILHNRDCSQSITCQSTATFCTQAYTGFPSYPIWTSNSVASVKNHIGGAEAYAVRVTPYFGGLMFMSVEWLYDYIENHNSTAIAQRARTVIRNHGFAVGY